MGANLGTSLRSQENMPISYYASSFGQTFGIPHSSDTPMGCIEFVPDGIDAFTSDVAYLIASPDTDFTKMTNDITRFWDLRSPRLVLTVISSEEDFKSWKTAELIDDFQVGLMKTANLTDLWILVDGRNFGASYLIGNAVAREQSRRANLQKEQKYFRFLYAEKLPPITVMGAVPMDKLSPTLNETLISGTFFRSQPVVLPMSGYDPETDAHKQLNPGLTHLFLYKETGLFPNEKMEGNEERQQEEEQEQNEFKPDLTFEDFFFALEMKFRKFVGRPKRHGERLESRVFFDPNTYQSKTPMIGLLIQGGPKDIKHALALMKINVPVILLTGTGRAADILAFAFKAAEETSYAHNYEVYVKTELLRRLDEEFPDKFRSNNEARNQCRDAILQCVALAQADPALLTLVSNTAHTSELMELDKYILTAVLKSKSQEPQTQMEMKDQLHWKLQLTIDWVRPDLALTLIFNKYGIGYYVVDHEQFQEVLLRPGREGFVDLFLDKGFMLHKFLSHTRLSLLFKRFPDSNFFIETCLENILGKSACLDSFVENKNNCLLNELLLILTSIKHLVNPKELTQNTGPQRHKSVIIAEQKALHALLYWSVLTNQPSLCRMLWARVNEPMAMALVMSTMYHRLAHVTLELDLKVKIKQIGIEFGKLAVAMLDLLYQESQVQALRALTIQLPDFQNNTALDLALIGKNKFFVAHPCCQKRIRTMWYGSMRIRENNLPFLPLPNAAKIVLSLFLVFPTFFWVEVINEKPVDLNNEKQNRLYEAPHSPKLPSNDRKMSVRKQFKHCPPVCLQQLFHLWTAPITNFCITTIASHCFLALFAYSLLLPFCGDWSLNKVVLVCLVLLFLDNLYLSSVLIWRYNESIAKHLRKSAVFLVTIGFMLFFRVLRYDKVSIFGLELSLAFYHAKLFLSFSLIYFFYHFPYSLFMTSTKLGPMLINILLMVKRDMITWFRIWALALFSGAVTVHAVLHPAASFSFSAVTRAFHRGLFAIFQTDVADLGGDESCSCLYDTVEEWGCKAQDQITEKDQTRLNTCTYSSFWGYFTVLQYLFLTKLVFYTLLFAICSVTMTNTFEKAVEIWKFHFFRLVNSFVKRPPLPVPFVVLLYPYILGKCVYTVGNAFRTNCCPCCIKKKEKEFEGETYNMWRAVIKQYKKLQQQKEREGNEPLETEKRMKAMSKVQWDQSRQIESLNDRLVGVLNNQTNTFLILEQMKHAIQELSFQQSMSKKEESVTFFIPQSQFHDHSRKSPYPGTFIRRFAVFDRYVSWEENYPDYDPGLYNRRLDEYDVESVPFVDPDVFELRDHERSLMQVTSSPDGGTPRVIPQEFKPEYHAIVSSMTDDGQEFTVDRTTWITKDDQPLHYILEVESGVPRNPMGRTGLRGRGALWRWGPNHVIYAIITRWRHIYSSTGARQGPVLVQGRRTLELMVLQNELTKEDSLPGGFITGRTSPYSVLCELFMKELLGEQDVVGSTQLDQDDMVQFFRQFVDSDFSLAGILGRAIPASSNFSYHPVAKGYMDDSLNTDNAWLEAEIWSFHYNTKDSFNKKLTDPEKHWRDVSPFMKLTPGHLPHVLKVAKMYDDPE